MKRGCGGLTVLVLLAGLVVVSGTASASDTNGSQPGSWVKGQPPFDFPLATPLGPVPVKFDIEAGTAPWTPANTFSAINLNTSSTFSGDVVCLTIADLANGNDGAWFRGVITSSTEPAAPTGFGILGRVVDNDAPAIPPANRTTDEAAAFLTPATPFLTCPPILFPTSPISTAPPPGNVVVH